MNCVVAGDVALEGRRATALPSNGPVPNGLAKLQEHFKSQNEGVFEIGVKPSVSGRTEVITHRFFRPNE